MATVCGKWGLELLSVEKRDGALTHVPYLFWVAQHPDDYTRVEARKRAALVRSHWRAAARHCHVAEQVYGAIAAALPVGHRPAVVEYFGGSGLQATIIHHLLDPAQHVICESNLEAVHQLRATLGAFPGVEVVYFEDFLAAAMLRRPADVVSLDTPDFSLVRWRRYYDAGFQHIFARRPQFVVLNETAGGRYHLHHRTYTTLLGMPVPAKYVDYLPLLGQSIGARYGYGLWQVYRYPRRGIFVLRPGPQPPAQIIDVNLTGYERALVLQG